MLVAVALSLLPAPAAATRHHPSVIILSSYHPGFAWSDAEVSGLLKRLREDHPKIDPPVEYLDAKRHPGDSSLSRVKDFLIQKYQGHAVALVICFDNPALDMLVRYRDELFPDAAIVFGGINGFDPDRLNGRRHVTGVAEIMDNKGTIEMALALHPEARQVLVVVDQTISGLNSRREIEALAPFFAERAQFRYLPPCTFEEAAAEMSALPESSIVLLSSFATDSSGRSLSLAESTRFFVSGCRAPVYSTHETRLGHGIVGGRLLDGIEHGRRTGEMALRVLAGEDPDTIPVDAGGTARPMFDYHQLKRFGVSLQSLPENSFILNNPVSVVDTNRSLVLGTLAVIAALVVLIVYLTLSITRRRRVEEDLRRSEARYRLLSENTADVIWTMNVATGRFTYVSPSVSRLRGFTPEEVMELTSEETLAPDSYRSVMERLSKRLAAFSSGDESARIQTHVVEQVRKDGSIVPAEAVTTLLTDERGQVTEILGVTRDITERKRAEDSLREREAKLRSIFRAAPVGIGMTLDRVFQEVNETMCAITGFSRDELIGQNARMLYVSQEDYERTGIEKERRVDERGTGTVETRWRRKDGSIREIVLSSTPLDGTDPSKGTIFTALDTTERNRAERALRESEYFLRKSQQVARLGSYLFDAQSGSWISSETLDEVLGIDGGYPRSIEGWIALVHPDQKEEMLHYFQGHVLSERKAFDKEYRIIRHTDGQERWIHGTGELELDGNGRPVKMIGTIQDITERKLAEAALKKSQSLLDEAQRLTSLGSWEMKIEGREIIWSDQIFRLFGLRAGELRPTFEDFVTRSHPDDRERVSECFREILEAGEFSSFDHRIVKEDGTVRWVHASGRVDCDGEGVPVGIVGTVQDITEKKSAQEEKTKLEARLAQAQRLESIGRLAGGVAHDFNNMLSVVLGYAELIKAGLAADEPMLKDIMEIERAALTSRDITRQLLAFSRKQIIQPKPLKPDRHIAETRKTLARLIGEDIVLHSRSDKDLWTIELDPTQLDQILMNLCVNARDAMPDGGMLTVEASNAVIDSTYCCEHFYSEPGEYVLLEISDDGAGMDKEVLSHIFEPFFTTKDVGRGTGLGLATVYGIVKQNRGFINAYSEPGQGTTFKIYFPRALVEEAPGKAEEAPIASGAGTVLLVEDSEPVRRLITTMLETMGYNVLAAETAPQALSIAKKGDFPFDLLITDVVMPSMNGVELRDGITAINPGIKVLFMSGYSADTIAHRGVLKDGVHFIQKPFSMRDLALKIREVASDGGHGRG